VNGRKKNLRFKILKPQKLVYRILI